MKIYKSTIILFLIILLGSLLRFYGINWDQGFKLHPDERAIVSFTLPLQLPQDVQEFLEPTSPLNPHFFAYGNFPLYLLKTSGTLLGVFAPQFATYDSINLVGRFISVFSDLGTIILVFLIGRLLFKKEIGLLAAFLYSIAVFPIQASHFYAVDILLTFFITATIYHSLVFYKRPSKKRAILIGLFFGLSLVTKISALTLLVAIIATLSADFIALIVKQPHKPRTWFPHIPIFLKRLLAEGMIIVGTTLTVFIILQPYALIDFKTFIEQNKLQSEMTHNAFVFPYTLQYVNKIPYLYEFKNIYFFGLSPIFGTFTFAGFFLYLFFLFKDKYQEKRLLFIVYLTFAFVYFIIVGKFAVGWMRYMLPLYPYFAIFAAILIYHILLWIQCFKKNIFFYKTFCTLLFIILLLWPLSFMHIYTKPNTRVLASEWINQHIPSGATIALEHWDDSLPLTNQQNYHIETLALYESDTEKKWAIINQQLQKADYIILASNRLYVPLMKLTDCEKLPLGRCYTKTAQYYKKLFNGSLGFKKIAEFSVEPQIPFTNLIINDQSADEAFTVYDHPKVLIFKKDK